MRDTFLDRTLRDQDVSSKHPFHTHGGRQCQRMILSAKNAVVIAHDELSSKRFKLAFVFRTMTEKACFNPDTQQVLSSRCHPTTQVSERESLRYISLAGRPWN